MTINQKVWLISVIILIVCVVIAIIVYLRTGHLFIAILLAPPLIHYALKYRNKKLSD